MKKLLEKHIFNSRIQSQNVTAKEKWLGDLVGSAGALLSIPLVVICRVLLYLVPTHASTTVKAVWIIVTYNLYYCFAFTMHIITHMMMVPLSTRNDMQRSQLAVFNNVANIAITGILAALLFPILGRPA